MPAKSKAQYRFMQAIAHGWKPDKGAGPSKSQAAEYVSEQDKKDYKKLPEKKKKKEPVKKEAFFRGYYAGYMSKD